MIEREVPVETDKMARIPLDLLRPSFEDRRFIMIPSEGRTVFLALGYQTRQLYQHGPDLVPGAFYNYSDRLPPGFGWDKYKEAHERARELVGNDRSARYFEEMLRILYGKPEVQLVHIIAAVNWRGNGEPYQIFGTIDPTETQTETSK